MYMTSDGRSLKEDYQWQAKGQFHGEPLRGRLEIDVTLYFDRKGRKDWDNFHKLSMDALSGIVWEDDDQIDDAHVHKRHDKENPRIEIKVSPLEYPNCLEVGHLNHIAVHLIEGHCTPVPNLGASGGNIALPARYAGMDQGYSPATG